MTGSAAPVNLASRVTLAARPGSVLASESAREQIGEEERFVWSLAGGRRLKNIKGEIKLFRVRRRANATAMIAGTPRTGQPRGAA